MAFKEIGASVKFVSAKSLKEGQVCIEGWFMGDFQSKYGRAFKFLQKNGEMVAIRNYAIIERKLEEGVKEHDYVQISYLGTYTVKQGNFAGSEGKNFKVLIDDEHEGPSSDLVTGSKQSEDGNDESGDLVDSDDSSDDIGLDLDVPF
jgi:hypothetical protein